MANVDELDTKKGSSWSLAAGNAVHPKDPLLAPNFGFHVLGPVLQL